MSSKDQQASYGVSAMVALTVIGLVLVVIGVGRAAYGVGRDDGHEDGFEQGIKWADARAKMWGTYEQGF